MKTNKFKRYAYFSKLELSDFLQLSLWEYTINRVIDDVIDTLSLPPVSQITLGDLVALLFLPVRLPLMFLLCPYVMRNQIKFASNLTEDEVNNRHLQGICLYTVDWKNKFKRSKPTSWNDY